MEAYLPDDFRLACQASVVATDQDIEFAIIRRRMHILEATGETASEVDPVVTVEGDAVLYDGAPIDHARGRLLGLAIDVGTTTVVFRVIDLVTGRTVTGGAFENPQRFGGSDVMSRITYEATHPGALRQALRRALNGALKEVYAEADIDRHCIYEAMVVANSTMRDMFFDLDVAPIGRMPYKSVTEELVMARGEADSTWLTRLAHELGVFMNPHGRVVGAPLVASHVGGDVAADLVATGSARCPGRRCSWSWAPTRRWWSATGGASGCLQSRWSSLRGRPAALRHAGRGRGHREGAHRGRRLRHRGHRRRRAAGHLRLRARGHPGRAAAGGSG